MTTNDGLNWVIALVSGCVLGGVFYGGLFWTVRHLSSIRRLGVGLFVSFVLRTLGVLLGFYYVSGQNFARLLFCVFGFTVARYVVLAITREPVALHPRTRPGTDHAS